ncbi:DNA-processing protein DprA [uncultured Clostridium sp.]|uniref:DNA-processing protein DprA n=1 Tax=uncultured Clostridium sp. TaxID=59620 RepID=UPI002608E3E9|nr:DNA-processing protein DprA [uncultured Clostridium sp.]
MDFYVLWLISLEIKNIDKINLLKMYKNEENIYNNFENIKRTIHINNLQNLTKRIQILKNYLNEGDKIIVYNMKEYPEELKNIENPPYYLFYKGNIELLNKKILSIVGGRKHTSYGEQVTKFITKEAVLNGYVIGSGGARGIDSIAHKEALENGGETIAVLGCGIDVLYPKGNKKLFSELEKRGLIVTEFFLGTPPFSYNFPMRNRIISGIARYLIVTEANYKSGSLITVNYALEKGIEIGVVPSSIFSELGYGCNMLLKEGAVPIISRQSLSDFLKFEEKNIRKVNSLIEEEILTIIRDEPMHIDKIFEKAKVDRNTLYKVLFEMQIKNNIVSLPGNYYARII